MVLQVGERKWVLNLLHKAQGDEEYLDKAPQRAQSGRHAKPRLSTETWVPSLIELHTGKASSVTDVNQKDGGKGGSKAWVCNGVTLTMLSVRAW